VSVCVCVYISLSNFLTSQPIFMKVDTMGTNSQHIKDIFDDLLGCCTL
jgi:hypothetical protein